MVRGIVIDPYERTISEVDHDGTLNGMYATLKQDAICRVRLTDHRDSLWVDDNGLLREGVPVFRLKGYGNPLAGIGLVLGLNDDGESIGTGLPLEFIHSIVIWTDEETTGQLTPSREYFDERGAHVFETGAGILRKRVL